MTLLRGRHGGSLLALWIAVLALAAGMYWLQDGVPALADLLRPIYAILGVLLVVATWRWFRWRMNNSDRRRTDRRFTFRHRRPQDDGER